MGKADMSSKLKGKMGKILIVTGIGIVLLLILYLAFRPTRKLENLEADKIERIQYSGWLGVPDSGTSADITDEDEIEEFVDLMHRVQLGRRVPRQLSGGADSEYILCYKNGGSLRIKPGSDFLVDGKCYELLNEEEVWDDIVAFNSRS